MDNDAAKSPSTVAELIHHLSVVDPETKIYFWSEASECEKPFDLNSDIDINRKTNRVVLDVG